MPAGRYAPSPTGALHLGNLRTALVAWLAARATDRAFLLRIEDLDRVRAVRGAQGGHGGVVQGGAFGLAHRLGVPVQPDGGQVRPLPGLGPGADAVQVLDPQQEGAVRGARREPRDERGAQVAQVQASRCLLYTSPSPRDRQKSRMPSSA